jgi:hypothetical protein
MSIHLKSVAALAAIFALTCGAARAGQIDYVLSGDAGGYYAQDANPNLMAFSTRLVFDWTGTPPGVDDTGVARLIPLSQGLLGNGGSTGQLTINFAYPTFLGIGEGPNVGAAGIITDENGALVLHAEWLSPALTGYVGGPLASTPVTFNFMDVLYAQGAGHSYTVFLDTLADAHFSASNAPEPAQWTLMLTGFGLLGAALRRRGAAAVKAA